jgi:hypothetical protein
VMADFRSSFMHCSCQGPLEMAPVSATGARA